jgi:hypothetical protein
MNQNPIGSTPVVPLNFPAKDRVGLGKSLKSSPEMILGAIFFNQLKMNFLNNVPPCVKQRPQMCFI